MALDPKLSPKTSGRLVDPYAGLERAESEKAAPDSRMKTADDSDGIPGHRGFGWRVRRGGGAFLVFAALLVVCIFIAAAIRWPSK